jgi:hypothetical protein
MKNHDEGKKRAEKVEKDKKVEEKKELHQNTQTTAKELNIKEGKYQTTS